MELVFLHGALGCADHWNAVANRFADGHDIHLLDFPGHGKSTLQPACSLEGLTDFLSAYINEKGLSNPVIFAYSMGGYVALNAQINGKIKAGKIITIGTKFKWNEEIAKAETSRLNWDTMGVIREKLENEHGQNLASLFDCTTSIMMGIGKMPLTSEDLSRVDAPSVIMVGERDKMVSIDESKEAAASIPNGVFQMLEDQPHLLEKVNPDLLFDKLRQLLKD